VRLFFVLGADCSQKSTVVHRIVHQSEPHFGTTRDSDSDSHRGLSVRYVDCLSAPGTWRIHHTSYSGFGVELLPASNIWRRRPSGCCVVQCRASKFLIRNNPKGRPVLKLALSTEHPCTKPLPHSAGSGTRTSWATASHLTCTRSDTTSRPFPLATVSSA
jgi:hypothetical protein